MQIVLNEVNSVETLSIATSQPGRRGVNDIASDEAIIHCVAAGITGWDCC